MSATCVPLFTRYLVAKSQNGKFILRIEDTDRERLVDGAVDVIYNTLKLAGLQHDEGPDLGGDFGPYVQSERKDMYLPYAEQLIKEGKAYRCFCSKERLEKIQNETVAAAMTDIAVIFRRKKSTDSLPRAFLM